jgi:hypothetical protein
MQWTAHRRVDGRESSERLRADGGIRYDSSAFKGPASGHYPPNSGRQAVPSIESTRLAGRIPYVTTTTRFTMRDECSRGVWLRDERVVRCCDTWMRLS